MRSPTLHVDMEACAAFAPDSNHVGLVPRLKVQLYVGVREQLGNESPRSGRTCLFRGLHQKDDLLEVRKIKVMEDLESVDSLDDAPLLIGNARPVGSPVVCMKGPALRGAGSEHRIDMPDHENAGLTTAGQRRHRVIRKSGLFRRNGLNRHSQRLQARNQNARHFSATVDVARPRVDVHDLLEQLELGGARSLRGGQDLGISRRCAAYRRDRQQHRRGRRHFGLHCGFRHELVELSAPTPVARHLLTGRSASRTMDTPRPRGSEAGEGLSPKI